MVPHDAAEAADRLAVALLVVAGVALPGGLCAALGWLLGGWLGL